MSHFYNHYYSLITIFIMVAILATFWLLVLLILVDYDLVVACSIPGLGFNSGEKGRKLLM